MNDSKNLILAVVLSALVLLGWTWAANKYFPTANPPSTKIAAGKQQPLPQPNAQPGPTGPKRLQSVSAALASSPRVSIHTPSLMGSINLKGAQIDDLLLLTQKQTIEVDGRRIRAYRFGSTRIGFVLRGKREYQLLCQLPPAGDDTDGACDLLFKSFSLA